MEKAEIYIACRSELGSIYVIKVGALHIVTQGVYLLDDEDPRTDFHIHNTRQIKGEDVAFTAVHCLEKALVSGLFEIEEAEDNLSRVKRENYQMMEMLKEYKRNGSPI